MQFIFQCYMYSLSPEHMIFFQHKHLIECIIRNISYENIENQKIRFYNPVSRWNYYVYSMQQAKVYLFQQISSNCLIILSFYSCMIIRYLCRSLLIHNSCVTLFKNALNCEGKSAIPVISSASSYGTMLQFPQNQWEKKN